MSPVACTPGKQCLVCQLSLGKPDCLWLLRGVTQGEAGTRWLRGCHRHVPQRGPWDVPLVTTALCRAYTLHLSSPSRPTRAHRRAECLFALTKAFVSVWRNGGAEHQGSWVALEGSALPSPYSVDILAALPANLPAADSDSTEPACWAVAVCTGQSPPCLCVLGRGCLREAAWAWPSVLVSPPLL